MQYKLPRIDGFLTADSCFSNSEKIVCKKSPILFKPCREMQQIYELQVVAFTITLQTKDLHKQES